MTANGPSKEFCRQAFVPISDDTHVMVHYIGDETVSQNLPHGNCKTKERPFIRTAPSVLKSIKTNNYQEPSLIYKRYQTQSGIPNVLQGVLNPRNMKQVQNTQQNERKKRNLSRDNLYNLHEVAYHLDGYVWKIETFPDLLVIIGLQEIVDEFQKVIQVPLANTGITQAFSYDTTFEIGDFFLTPLIFRHILFEGSPLIPLAYMIHERRHQNFHATFLRCLKERCPGISKFNLPVLLDRERAMTTAFQQHLPNLDILYCWNHIRRDVKLWLRRHNATSAEIPLYMDGIIRLLESNSPEEFEDTKAHVTDAWSEAMIDYYLHHLEKDFKEHATRYVIEKHGLYNPFSGITNNNAESENAVIKRLVEGKEVPVDSIVLALHMEQQYLMNEALRGRCGLGQYKLRRLFASANLDLEEVKFCPISCNPEDIVAFIRDGNSIEEDKENVPESDTTDQPIVRDSAQRSQMAMAIETERRGNVVHVPQLKTFMVEGLTGQKYAVSLFPKEKCQCPSSTVCYHILAAKLSINISVEPKQRQYNLTALRKNARCRSEKKMGRKHQNIDSKSFTPAPDSKAAKRAHSESASKTGKKSPLLTEFVPGCSPIGEEAEIPPPEESKKSRRTLSFDSQPEDSQAKCNDLNVHDLTTDELMTVYEMAQLRNLQIPKDTAEFQQKSETDPVLSFFKESRNLVGTFIDTTSEELLSKIPASTEDKASTSAAIQLTAAVLLISQRLEISPFLMMQTLLLVPDHLTQCQTTRAAPNHSLRVYNNDVGRNDLRTLDGTNWLNDKIMHAYLGVLMREKNDIEPNQIFVLPSFLALKWLRGDFRSWTYSKVELKAFKYVLLPICVSNQHWILLVAEMKKKLIAVYDSLAGKDHSVYLNYWRSFLDVRGELSADDTWGMSVGKSSSQSDGHSCGVFVLMNAEAIVNNVPTVVMRQVHCENYRVYIKRRLVDVGRKNNEIVCEQPFCSEPTRKQSSTLQCDHCNRWFHKICAGMNNKPKRYVCLMCIE